MNSNHLASPQAQPLPTRARTLLAALTNDPHAAFHTRQYQAIEALVAHRRRVLVVQRTGWGKSAVYFIAALLLREQGAGPALIISPLLALMRDQVAAAERAGVRAAMLNSSNVTDWDDIRTRLESDQIDVLLISPERLNNPAFRDEWLPQLAPRLGLLVVDEAHCISDWGTRLPPRLPGASVGSLTTCRRAYPCSPPPQPPMSAWAQTLQSSLPRIRQPAAPQTQTAPNRKSTHPTPAPHPRLPPAGDAAPEGARRTHRLAYRAPEHPTRLRHYLHPHRIGGARHRPRTG